MTIIRNFGKGEICVATGEYNGAPIVLIYPANKIGIVGDSVPEKEMRGNKELKSDELLFTFPTHDQAKLVADALCNALNKETK